MLDDVPLVVYRPLFERRQRWRSLVVIIVVGPTVSVRIVHSEYVNILIDVFMPQLASCDMTTIVLHPKVFPTAAPVFIIVALVCFNPDDASANGINVQRMAHRPVYLSTMRLETLDDVLQCLSRYVFVFV